MERSGRGDGKEWERERSRSTARRSGAGRFARSAPACCLRPRRSRAGSSRQRPDRTAIRAPRSRSSDTDDACRSPASPPRHRLRAAQVGERAQRRRRHALQRQVALALVDQARNAVASVGAATCRQTRRSARPAARARWPLRCAAERAHQDRARARVLAAHQRHQRRAADLVDVALGGADHEVPGPGAHRCPRASSSARRTNGHASCLAPAISACADRCRSAARAPWPPSRARADRRR